MRSSRVSKVNVTRRRSMTTEKLTKEIAALDQEARDSLDKLADKREELERQHRATELAAERQREREEERRREEEREAEEREQLRRREEADKLGRERLRLEVLAEEQAEALNVTLGKLLELDPGHRRAVVEVWGTAPEQIWGRSFPRELLDWFLDCFGGTMPGIGHPIRECLALPERDALTPAKEGGGG